MIEPLQGLPDGVIGFVVSGQIVASDYRNPGESGRDRRSPLGASLATPVTERAL